MAQVSPSLDDQADARRPAAASISYELVPLHELPIVDMSVSIRSRLLSHIACESLSRSMRKWGCLLDAGYAIALVSAPLIIGMPIKVGNVIACVTSILSLPGALLGPTLLRYQLLQLLLRTYDFWFFTLLVFTTFTVLGMVLGPWRALSLPISALGALTNVVVDANLRVPKSWVVYSSFAMTMHTATVILASLELIDGMRDFMILEIQAHALPASTFVSSGLLTVCTLLARSIYRRREAVALHNYARNPTEVRCVGYRTLLRYTRAPRTQLMGVPQSTSDPSPTPGPIQQLRYDPSIGLLDASDTVATGICSKVVAFTSSHCQLMKFIHALGLTSIGMAFVLNVTSFASGQPSNPHVLTSALGVTSTYCVPFALCYHRRLLMALLKSFDFVFLSTQVTFCHLCACDFFRWTFRSMALAGASWIWIHWVLCIDALSPLVRACLGFHVRMAAAPLSLCFVGSIAVVVSMVFSPPSDAYDRTLWSGTVLGHHVHFRLLPLFYSCFVTVITLTLRVLWRLYTVSNETLVMLDGVVLYDNYLLRKKSAAPHGQRRSAEHRSFSSIFGTRKTGPYPLSHGRES